MKTPVIRQNNQADCGLACLAMIAATYGKHVNLATLKEQISSSQMGMGLNQMIRGAKDLGLDSRALKLELEEAKQLKRPAILIWGANHYVVLLKVGLRHWKVIDPAFGERSYSLKEVNNHFSGIALELFPANDFQKQSKSPSLTLRQLWSGQHGLKHSFAIILAMSAGLQIMLLLSPLYIQMVVDNGLARNDKDLIPLLAVGFAGLVLLRVVSGFTRSMIVLQVSNQLTQGFSSSFYNHLLRLSLKYFLDRDVGDIISRFGSLEPVYQLFTVGIVTIIIDGILALSTIFLLLAYSLELTVVVVVVLVLLLLIQLLLVPKMREYTADSIQAEAVEKTAFIESLRSIVSLKANAMERARHLFWHNKLCASIAANNRLAALGIRIDSVIDLFSSMELILVVALGAMQVIEAEMSIGMLYAFIAYRGHFSGATNKLIEQLVGLRMLKLHLERLGDIALRAPETAQKISSKEIVISGHIDINNLCFTYSADQEMVFNDLNIQVRVGEHIGIIGRTATGKTTLIKLILGLLKPSRGEILFDDINIEKIGGENIRQHIGVVMQGDSLFSGSITENVALFELDVDQQRVEDCCGISGIAADIDVLPMRYETQIGDMGVVLSAGQIQRLLIARALYKQPDILILDEATVNLDESTRKKVNAGLRSQKATTIRITHQREELQYCDQVYLLHEGQLLKQDNPENLNIPNGD